MSEYSRRFSFLRGCACVAAAALLVAVSPGWAGQKNKKQKNSEASSNSTDSSITSLLPDTPQAESEKINDDIGEMLAAFQVGNTEMMHKYYSDDCTFVQSTYDPPVVGWQKYAALYDREKSAYQGMELIRRNTDIFVHQDVAWASYQWEFDGTWQDHPYSLRGQTTLVFTKVGGNWLIVHNHTSEVIPENTQQATTQTSQQTEPAQATPVAAKP
ncbi:MAG TPA: nuclear transport factor 2 family protein [Candidatus Aquilonibacter sp.]|nr:nuclear transport factor 2 family protein [Candidatus Aquilonibacter sp.]